MNKIMKYTLDNGLKVFLIPDKTKNTTLANIFTFAGGKDTTFYIDDREVNVPKGCAHFLEHYLIEHSIYGNALRMFSDDYIITNGVTNFERTEYYISTVHDFKENLIKLLNIVNNPVFNEDDINDTKNPIISEIDRFNDNKYLKFKKDFSNQLLCNNELYNTLGEKEDIYNMTVDDLRNFHKALYKADNQMLVITGNVDESIIDVIKDEYKKFDNSCNSKKKEFIEDVKVKEKDKSSVCNINEPLFEVGIKIPISTLSPLEKNKLDYYLSYIVDYNFDIRSKLYNELRRDGLITYSFSTSYLNYTKDLVSLIISNETNDYDKVIESVLDKLNNLEYNEEDFNVWKNRRIIRTINSLEQLSYKHYNFINNYDFYRYETFDDLDFVKSLNFKELKEMVSKIDFTNYTVLKNILK